MTCAKTIFVADAHLLPGDCPEQNARLKRLLDEGEQARVVLLGDAFNAWFERRGRVTGDYAAVLKLFSVAAGRGAEIHHVSGNRDFAIGAGKSYPGFYGFFGGGARSVLADNGIEPHGTCYHFSQDGLKVACEHGDRFCVRDRRYQRLRWLLQGPVGRWAMGIAPFALPSSIFAGVQKKPLRLPSEKFSKQEIVPEAAWPQVTDGTDLIVCGHVHREERYPLAAAGRAGELVVVPPWYESGKFALLENGRLEIIKPER
jgi:UDP-2,3-diacylglucosamine hydrolase